MNNLGIFNDYECPWSSNGRHSGYPGCHPLLLLGASMNMNDLGASMNMNYP